ncbi:NAD-dependent epimerase/dehydratase family protein [Actinopolyspora mzabensis]|uniref:NAD-dependent epimerase/dehydratase family protein n=1 Tax=Actinopolyspora mzabensis TaxID=995066 RepID=UPI0015A1E4FF
MFTLPTWAPTISGPATNPYLRGKRAASEEVLLAAAAGTVHAGVLRIANVAGPGASSESPQGRGAGQLAKAAARGETATIKLTALHTHRDHVEVRDVSEAIMAASRPRRTGATIGIGRGEAVPVGSLLELLIEVSKVPTRLVELPAPAGSDDDWERIDPRSARDLPGCSPRRTPRHAPSGVRSRCTARAVAQRADYERAATGREGASTPSR